MGHIKLTDFGLSKVGLMNSKLFKSTYCIFLERASERENDRHSVRVLSLAFFLYGNNLLLVKDNEILGLTFVVCSV